MRWISVPSPAHRLAVLRLAESAARARPEDPEPQRVHGEALEAVGNREEAVARLAEACARFPEHRPLHEALAGVLTRLGRIEDALEQVSPWLPDAWARKLQFKLLMRSGRSQELSGLEAALAEADPADPDLLEYRSVRLRDAPDAMLRACDAVLAHDPSASHVVYHKALALARLGRGGEAAGLMDIDRFFRSVRLDPPAPFGGEGEFNAELAREIRANTTLHSDPAGHATRQGLRTASFPLPGDAAGTALLAAVRAQVEDYADALSGDHPFVAARPDRATIKSWALLFEGRGHQSLHHHPGAWLTGVYYVAAPARATRAGALRVGSVPDWLGQAAPWKTADVEPVPGTLLLFPSFVAHETLPTGSDETRISVAFDVTAAARRG